MINQKEKDRKSCLSLTVARRIAHIVKHKHTIECVHEKKFKISKEKHKFNRWFESLTDSDKTKVLDLSLYPILLKELEILELKE